MTDEAGILLRVSIFGLVAAVVYWFLSYEAFGPAPSSSSATVPRAS